MLIHMHSGDERFCGSKEQGRRFSMDLDAVTCGDCKPAPHAPDCNLCGEPMVFDAAEGRIGDDDPKDYWVCYCNGGNYVVAE